MNKGITILIVVVVLAAMGLVFYSHTRQSPGNSSGGGLASDPSSPPGIASSSGAPAGAFLSGGASGPSGNASGLRQIEPPLGSDVGAPRPLAMTPSEAIPSPDRSAGRAGSPAPRGDAGRSGGAGASGTNTSGAGAPEARIPGTPPVPPPATGRAAPGTGAPGTGAAGTGATDASQDGTPAVPGPRFSDTAPRISPLPINEPARSTPGADGNKPAASSGAAGTRATASSAAETGAAVSPVPSAGAPGTAATSRASAREEDRKVATAKPPAPSVKLSDKGKHQMKAINFRFSGQKIILVMQAGDPFPVKTFVLTEPDRLVVDLPGTWTGVAAPSVPQNRVIKGARIGQQPGGPRLVLDLNAAPKGNQLERDGDTVELTIW